jgi:hypothetical protein
MTITNHEDLCATAQKALQLHADLRYLRKTLEGYSHTEQRIAACWNHLCATLDAVVAAAGGHRDYLTWHFFGETITAKDLWLITSDLEGFLFSRPASPAHQRMAVAFFWATPKPLPTPKDTKAFSLPAPGGKTTEADAKSRTSAAGWLIEAIDGDDYARLMADEEVQAYLENRGKR